MGVDVILAGHGQGQAYVTTAGKVVKKVARVVGKFGRKLVRKVVKF